jgi:hypothetical protein
MYLNKYSQNPTEKAVSFEISNFKRKQKIRNYTKFTISFNWRGKINI